MNHVEVSRSLLVNFICFLTNYTLKFAYNHLIKKTCIFYQLFFLFCLLHLYDQLVLYILSQIQHSINEDKVYDINQNVPFVIR